MNKRYFFVSVMGIDNDDCQVFNNYEMTLKQYPSIKKIEEQVKIKRPKIKHVLILGITEMSESDYKTFRGE